jgi:hypothetical protein
MTNSIRFPRLLVLTAAFAAAFAVLPDAPNHGGLLGISVAQAKDHSGGHHGGMSAGDHDTSRGSQRNGGGALAGATDGHDIAQGSQRNRGADPATGMNPSNISQGSQRNTR